MKNCALVLSVILLTGMSVGCRKTATPRSSVRRFAETPSVAAYDDADAYSIYNALLSGNMNARAARQSIAVLNQTHGHELCFDPASQRDSRLREAAFDFMRQNSNSRLLQHEKFDPGRKVVFFSSSELDGLFSAGPFTGVVEIPRTAP